MEHIKKSNFPALFNKENVGIGYNIKRGIEYAKNNNYQAVAIIPGNNKNDPNQVDRLFKPIYEDGFDYLSCMLEIRRNKKKRGSKWVTKKPTYLYKGIYI